MKTVDEFKDRLLGERSRLGGLYMDYVKLINSTYTIIIPLFAGGLTVAFSSGADSQLADVLFFIMPLAAIVIVGTLQSISFQAFIVAETLKLTERTLKKISELSIERMHSELLALIQRADTFSGMSLDTRPSNITSGLVFIALYGYSSYRGFHWMDSIGKGYAIGYLSLVSLAVILVVIFTLLTRRRIRKKVQGHEEEWSKALEHLSLSKSPNSPSKSEVNQVTDKDQPELKGV